MNALDPSAPTLALVRLLQLASPALPIGAYSYSQGLEWMVAAGDVPDAAAAQAWIGDAPELLVAPREAAAVLRPLNALPNENRAQAREGKDWVVPSAPTRGAPAPTQPIG